MFKKREFWQIVQSDVGIALVFAGLTMWSRATSFWNVVCYYGIPYMLCNHWLVLITFLQHTHESLPHYRASQWNFQRGALCTMDRHVFDFFVRRRQPSIRAPLILLTPPLSVCCPDS